MATSQLIPPADQAPPSIEHLSPADRVRVWAQMVDEGDQLIFAGFLRQLGDESQARQAAREWVDRRADDSAAAKARMLASRLPAESSDGG